jgi:hypothetical protein
MILRVRPVGPIHTAHVNAGVCGQSTGVPDVSLPQLEVVSGGNDLGAKAPKRPEIQDRPASRLGEMQNCRRAGPIHSIYEAQHLDLESWFAT